MNIFRQRSKEFEEFEAATKEWSDAQKAGHRIAQNIGRIAAETKSYEYLQHIPYADEVIKTSLAIPPNPDDIPFDQDEHEHSYSTTDTVLYFDNNRRGA